MKVLTTALSFSACRVIAPPPTNDGVPERPMLNMTNKSCKNAQAPSGNAQKKIHDNPLSLVDNVTTSLLCAIYHVETGPPVTLVSVGRGGGLLPVGTVCSHFDKKSITSSHLKDHERTHIDVKPHSCSYCDKYFFQLRDLKKHERTHTREKPFSCSHCDKKFSDSRILKDHERIHSDEKPFKCCICDYACKQKHGLIEHERTHSDEKHFKCDICDRRFVQSCQLKCHMRIHTQEKPYKCKICDAAFSHNVSLTAHTKKYHSTFNPTVVLSKCS